MPEVITYPTLYKKDTTGNIRVWWIEREDSRYRVVSGVQGSPNMVESGWKQAHAKGVGRARTTPEEQAEKQIASVYKGKTDRSYHRDIADVDKKIMFEVMLAEKYSTWDKFQKRLKKDFPDHGPVYMSQPKLDGMRSTADPEGLTSRGGKPILGAPHIMEALAEFFVKFPDAMLDGELYNHDYNDDFNTIIGRVKKDPTLAKRSPEEADAIRKLSREVIQYHVYDTPSHDGKYSERYQWLRDNLPQNDFIKLVRTDEFTTEEELNELMAEYLEDGYEGQMIRLDEPYENDRTHALLKNKEFEDEEFEFVSAHEGTGNWAGVAKSIKYKLKSTPDGKVPGRPDYPSSGMRGNKKFAKFVLENAANWRKVTIRYQNLTPDGVLRMPVVIKFWDEEALATGDRD